MQTRNRKCADRGNSVSDRTFVNSRRTVATEAVDKQVSTPCFSVRSIALCCLLATTAVPAYAGWLDGVRSAVDKARETVQEAHDTVTGTQQVIEDAKELRNVIYNDSYTPDTSEASSLQSALTKLGFSLGAIDGNIGHQTRQALLLYQSLTGLAADGNMTRELVQDVIARGEQVPYAVPASLTRLEWQEYQQYLNELGYDAGKPDGLPGKRTRAAVQRFLDDQQLPNVNGIDRYGFDAARSVAGGGPVQNTALAMTQGTGFSAAGSSAFNSATTSNAGTASSSGSSLSDSLAQLNAQDQQGMQSRSVAGGSSAPWLVYGADWRSGEADAAVQRALAVMLIEDNPRLLDDMGYVDAWFRADGHTVESEYLREKALLEFRESLRQETVERPLRIKFVSSVAIWRGDYNAETGIFKVAVGPFGRYLELPHLAFNAIDLDLISQISGRIEAETVDPKKVTGIPMSLEEAIAFEKEEMGQRDKLSSLPIVAEALIHAIELPPLKRDQTVADYRMGVLQRKATSTLSGLSIHRQQPRSQGDSKLGELFYQFPIDATQPTSSDGSAPVRTVQPVAVSSDLQSLASRFQMRVVDGYLDTSSGNSQQSMGVSPMSQFAAAMALGAEPELLDKQSLALILASALLTHEERIELFGVSGAYRVAELDDVSRARIHERIKGELRPLLLSRAVPSDVPLLLVHDASLHHYDPATGRFPIQTRNKSVYAGWQELANGSRGPSLWASFGDRWVPQSLVWPEDQVANFVENVFTSRSGSRPAAVRHGRFGSVSDVKVRFEQPRSGSSERKLQVSFNLTVDREVLFTKDYDEVIAEFPLVHERQQSFSELIEITEHALATPGALLASVASYPETAAFREQFVLSANTVRDANEFDRQERVNEVNASLDKQAANYQGPLWMTGTVQLGEYQFDTQSFSVRSLALAGADRQSSGDSTYFRAKIAHKVYGDLRVSIPKEEAEQLVKSNASRQFTIRARVTPIGAVANLSGSRPDSASLTFTHQVDELALVDLDRNKHRQQWKLISHDTFLNTDQTNTASAGEAVAQEPIAINLGSQPLLDPDVLTLMSAQKSQYNGADYWNWLQQNRFIRDTKGLSELGASFFDNDDTQWDQSIAQINAPQFKAWVDALQFSELDAVRVRLATGYQAPRVSMELCNIARTSAQWNTNKEPTFVSSDTTQERREQDAEVRQLRRGEFLVKSDVTVGFVALSALHCERGGLSSVNTGFDNPPKITMTFDTLPLVSTTTSNTAIVTAKVQKLDFEETASGVPNIHIRLSYQQADFYDDSNTETGNKVLTLTLDDITEDKPAGKDPRLASADVVGVKLGMSLADAAAVLNEHFHSPDTTEIRRGFTTNPGRFEQGNVWFSKDSGEYIVVFFEGDEATADVLGVIRGLSLEGNGFDRSAALGVLRDKYGKEDHVQADDTLNMVWGRYVNSWPTQLGRKATGYQSGRGACAVELRANQIPGNLRNSAGTLVDLRKLLSAESRRGAFHVRWPSFGRSGTEKDLSACDYYLEAFHDDREDTKVFVGLFDIAAYEQAFAAMGDTADPDVQTNNAAGAAKKPAVKF